MEDGGAHWCVLIACLFTMTPDYNHIYSPVPVHCYSDKLTNLSSGGLVIPMKSLNYLSQEVLLHSL